jgi:hypothetical protein
MHQRVVVVGIGEFGAVSLLELAEPIRIMAKPSAQVGGWRDIPQPLIEIRCGLRQAARPHPINEYA